MTHSLKGFILPQKIENVRKPVRRHASALFVEKKNNPDHESKHEWNRFLYASLDLASAYNPSPFFHLGTAALEGVLSIEVSALLDFMNFSLFFLKNRPHRTRCNLSQV